MYIIKKKNFLNKLGYRMIVGNKLNNDYVVRNIVLFNDGALHLLISAEGLRVYTLFQKAPLFFFFFIFLYCFAKVIFHWYSIYYYSYILGIVIRAKVVHYEVWYNRFLGSRISYKRWKWRLNEHQAVTRLFSTMFC